MSEPRDIEVHAAGHALGATLFSPEPTTEAASGILFVHGLGSNRVGYRRRAEALTASLGAVVLTFDLRGHGADSRYDQVSPHEHLDDVLAAYDCLASTPSVATERIGVCGASYGGYLAVLATASRRVARLALRAPAIFADDLFDWPLADRARGVSAAQARKVFDALLRYPGEVIVVESEFDAEVPKEVIEAYVGTRTGIAHEVLLGATHSLTEPAWDATFTALLIDWFAAL